MSEISIVIPAFGNQAALDASLATLSVQHDAFRECIVVDDGSPTPLTVPDWCKIIRLHRKSQHRGSSFAKNIGARHATGEYLCFCDSDILHAPDAIASVAAKRDEWLAEGHSRVLLNVCRVSMAQDYVETDYERALEHHRMTGDLIDESMKLSYIAWEQNCGLISHAYFEELGGYDESAFPYWGFNNQDLCLRVALSKGNVTSAITRLSTGLRLFCFHMWHENGVKRSIADAEFRNKWGEEWHQTLYQKAIEGTFDATRSGS